MTEQENEWRNTCKSLHCTTYEGHHDRGSYNYLPTILISYRQQWLNRWLKHVRWRTSLFQPQIVQVDRYTFLSPSEQGL